MNERIKRLRQASLDAPNCLSAERALLVTEFYKSDAAHGISAPVMRAMAFRYILSNKLICINPDELIVGERGPAPKATPTYPEINLHSMRDLEILHSRKKVSFCVDEEFRKVYSEKVIPFWSGKTNRKRIFGNMAPEWLAAYDAGIFTEFQEQRASGHTVAGEKIFRKGMFDIIDDIYLAKKELDFMNDPAAYDKREELRAMEVAARVLIDFAERHAGKLDRMA